MINKIFDFAKSVLYWLISFSVKKIGYALMTVGLLAGGTYSFLYKPLDGGSGELSFTVSNTVNDWLSAILVVIGALILVSEVIKDLKKRAIIFQHLGIDEIKTFDIATARPVWDRLFRPEVHNIDCYRYYRNGIVVNPDEALRRTLSIGTTLENLSQVEPANLKFYYGGMIQVPFAFVAGTLLSNTMSVEVYDWNRNKQKAYPTSEQSIDKPLEIEASETDISSSNEVAIELEISYPVDRANTIQAAGKIPVIKISANPMGIDNASSLEQQVIICEVFHRLLDKYQGLERIHIFIAAQNSLVFQLGRQISKRVHPEIVVWQYERQNERKNPWGIKINNNNYNVVFNAPFYS